MPTDFESQGGWRAKLGDYGEVPAQCKADASKDFAN